MLSDYEARALDQIERQLTDEAPALATRLTNLDRGRRTLRLCVATVGVLAALSYAIVGAGAGDTLIGVLVAAACGWEVRRRVLELTTDRQPRPGHQQHTY